MSWTDTRTATFKRMYAAGATYAEICIALDIRMSQLQWKWAYERSTGGLRGLSDKRRKSRLAMKNGPFETVVEDGLTIKRYPARYAQGCSPQVGAVAKNIVEVE